MRQRPSPILSFIVILWLSGLASGTQEAGWSWKDVFSRMWNDQQSARPTADRAGMRSPTIEEYAKFRAAEFSQSEPVAHTDGYAASASSFRPYQQESKLLPRDLPPASVDRHRRLADGEAVDVATRSQRSLDGSKADARRLQGVITCTGGICTDSSQPDVWWDQATGPSLTGSASPSATASSSSTGSPSGSGSSTASPSSSGSASALASLASATAAASSSGSASASNAPSVSSAASPSSTATVSASSTASRSADASSTASASASASKSSAASSSASASADPTSTSSASVTVTMSSAPSSSASESGSATKSSRPSLSASASPSISGSPSSSGSATASVSSSATGTITPSASASSSTSPTATGSASQSVSVSASASASGSGTVTNTPTTTPTNLPPRMMWGPGPSSTPVVQTINAVKPTCIPQPLFAVGAASSRGGLVPGDAVFQPPAVSSVGIPSDYAGYRFNSGYGYELDANGVSNSTNSSFVAAVWDSEADEFGAIELAILNCDQLFSQGNANASLQSSSYYISRDGFGGGAGSFGAAGGIAPGFAGHSYWPGSGSYGGGAGVAQQLPSGPVNQVLGQLLLRWNESIPMPTCPPLTPGGAVPGPGQPFFAWDATGCALRLSHNCAVAPPLRSFIPTLEGATITACSDALIAQTLNMRLTVTDAGRMSRPGGNPASSYYAFDVPLSYNHAPVINTYHSTPLVDVYESGNATANFTAIPVGDRVVLLDAVSGAATAAGAFALFCVDDADGYDMNNHSITVTAVEPADGSAGLNGYTAAQLFSFVAVNASIGQSVVAAAAAFGPGSWASSNAYNLVNCSTVFQLTALSQSSLQSLPTKAIVLSATAWDGLWGAPSVPARFDVRLRRLNSPVAPDLSPVAVNTSENVPIGSVLATVSATDADATAGFQSLRFTVLTPPAVCPTCFGVVPVVIPGRIGYDDVTNLPFNITTSAQVVLQKDVLDYEIPALRSMNMTIRVFDDARMPSSLLPSVNLTYTDITVTLTTLNVTADNVPTITSISPPSSLGIPTTGGSVVITGTYLGLLDGQVKPQLELTNDFTTGGSPPLASPTPAVCTVTSRVAAATVLSCPSPAWFGIGSARIRLPYSVVGGVDVTANIPVAFSRPVVDTVTLASTTNGCTGSNSGLTSVVAADGSISTLIGAYTGSSIVPSALCNITGTWVIDDGLSACTAVVKHFTNNTLAVKSTCAPRWATAFGSYTPGSRSMSLQLSSGSSITAAINGTCTSALASDGSVWTRTAGSVCSDSGSGARVALTGSNFGTSAWATAGALSVTYGPSGTEHTPSSCWVSTDHTEITCLLPDGSGARDHFVVAVGGIASEAGSEASGLTRASPFITDIQPRVLPTTNGSIGTITITGANFGLVADAPLQALEIEPNNHTANGGGDASASMPLLRADWRHCAVTTDHTTITCTSLPPNGWGQGARWRVLISGQWSSWSAFTTDYAAPVLLSISPNILVPAGGEWIQVRGTSFGQVGVARVILGGWEIDPTDIVFGSHEMLMFRSPAGGGSNISLSVYVAGRNSSMPISYASPSLYELKYVDGDLDTRPLVLQFVGANFPFCCWCTGASRNCSSEDLAAAYRNCAGARCAGGRTYTGTGLSSIYGQIPLEASIINVLIAGNITEHATALKVAPTQLYFNVTRALVADVTIDYGGSVSEAYVYDKDVVLSNKPAIDGISPTLELPMTGGTTLIITGRNLGTAGSVVMDINGHQIRCPLSRAGLAPLARAYADMQTYAFLGTDGQIFARSTTPTADEISRAISYLAPGRKQPTEWLVLPQGVRPLCSVMSWSGSVKTPDGGNDIVYVTMPPGQGDSTTIRVEPFGGAGLTPASPVFYRQTAIASLVVEPVGGEQRLNSTGGWITLTGIFPPSQNLTAYYADTTRWYGFEGYHQDAYDEVDTLTAAGLVDYNAPGLLGGASDVSFDYSDLVPIVPRKGVDYSIWTNTTIRVFAPNSTGGTVGWMRIREAGVDGRESASFAVEYRTPIITHARPVPDTSPNSSVFLGTFPTVGGYVVELMGFHIYAPKAAVSVRPAGSGLGLVGGREAVYVAPSVEGLDHFAARFLMPECEGRIEIQLTLIPPSGFRVPPTVNADASVLARIVIDMDKPVVYDVIPRFSQISSDATDPCLLFYTNMSADVSWVGKGYPGGLGDPGAALAVMTAAIDDLELTTGNPHNLQIPANWDGVSWIPWLDYYIPWYGDPYAGYFTHSFDLADPYFNATQLTVAWAMSGYSSGAPITASSATSSPMYTGPRAMLGFDYVGRTQRMRCIRGSPSADASDAGATTVLVDVRGRNFGSGMSDFEVFVGGYPCVDPPGTSMYVSDSLLRCEMPQELTTAKGVPVSVQAAFRTVNTSDFGISLWVACTQGTFLNYDESCLDCPDGASCAGLEYPPVSQNDYWQTLTAQWAARGIDVFAANVDPFVPCPESGVCMPNQTCANGRDPTSWACTACPANMVADRSGACVDCVENQDTLNAQLASIVAAAILFLFFSIHRAIRKGEMAWEDAQDGFKPDAPETVELMKQGIGFVQGIAALSIYSVTQSVSNAVNLASGDSSTGNFLPNVVMQFKVVNQLGFSAAQLRCSVPNFYESTTIQFALPLLLIAPVFAVVFVIWIVTQFLDRCCGGERFWTRLNNCCSCKRKNGKRLQLCKFGAMSLTEVGLYLLSSLFIILFLSLNSVVTTAFSLGDCAAENQGGYLNSLPSISCYTPRHQSIKILGLIVGVVWLLVPLTIIVLLTWPFGCDPCRRRGCCGKAARNAGRRNGVGGEITSREADEAVVEYYKKWNLYRWAIQEDAPQERRELVFKYFGFIIGDYKWESRASRNLIEKGAKREKLDLKAHAKGDDAKSNFRKVGLAALHQAQDQQQQDGAQNALSGSAGSLSSDDLTGGQSVVVAASDHQPLHSPTAGRRGSVVMPTPEEIEAARVRKNEAAAAGASAFESINMIRNAVFVVFGTGIFYQDPQHQLSATVLLMVAFFIIHVVVQPYRMVAMNVLEGTSLFSTIVLAISILSESRPAGTQETPSGWRDVLKEQGVFEWFCIVCIFIYAALWVYFFVSAIQSDSRKILEKLFPALKPIFRRSPCCGRKKNNRLTTEEKERRKKKAEEKAEKKRMEVEATAAKAVAEGRTLRAQLGNGKAPVLPTSTSSSSDSNPNPALLQHLTSGTSSLFTSQSASASASVSTSAIDVHPAVRMARQQLAKRSANVPAIFSLRHLSSSPVDVEDSSATSPAVASAKNRLSTAAAAAANTRSPGRGTAVVSPGPANSNAASAGKSKPRSQPATPSGSAAASTAPSRNPTPVKERQAFSPERADQGQEATFGGGAHGATGGRNSFISMVTALISPTLDKERNADAGAEFTAIAADGGHNNSNRLDVDAASHGGGALSSSVGSQRQGSASQFAAATNGPSLALNGGAAGGGTRRTGVSAIPGGVSPDARSPAPLDRTDAAVRLADALAAARTAVASLSASSLGSTGPAHSRVPTPGKSLDSSRLSHRPLTATTTVGTSDVMLDSLLDAVLPAGETHLTGSSNTARSRATTGTFAGAGITNAAPPQGDSIYDDVADGRSSVDVDARIDVDGPGDIYHHHLTATYNTNNTNNTNDGYDSDAHASGAATAAASTPEASKRGSTMMSQPMASITGGSSAAPSAPFNVNGNSSSESVGSPGPQPLPTAAVPVAAADNNTTPSRSRFNTRGAAASPAPSSRSSSFSRVRIRGLPATGASAGTPHLHKSGSKPSMTRPSPQSSASNLRVVSVRERAGDGNGASGSITGRSAGSSGSDAGGAHGAGANPLQGAKSPSSSTSASSGASLFVPSSPAVASADGGTNMLTSAGLITGQK